MAELDISADKVARVILLAREIGEQTAVGAHDGLRDGRAGRQAEQEFRSYVADLDVDEQYALVAVMWIGRDSFDADEYDQAFATARQEAVNPTEDYLIGMPMLADYLESGLEALGIDPGEAEDDVV
jgi:hypothetical protein